MVVSDVKSCADDDRRNKTTARNDERAIGDKNQRNLPTLRHSKQDLAHLPRCAIRIEPNAPLCGRLHCAFRGQ